MRKNICEVIRRELDELNLDETCSTTAIEHLRECGECREFHEKQTKLRQIVGSLGTVAAPADFDFRLRARLANESSSAASGFNFVAWPVFQRGVAAAALVIVFATGALLVRNIVTRPGPVVETAKDSPAPRVTENPGPVGPVVTPVAPVTNNDVGMTLAPSKRPQRNKMDREQVAVRNTRPLATIDSSSIGATVLNGAEPVGASEAIPIDGSSLQSFRVLVDDGRGNAKTISVPTISFGSQRLMQNANQLAPKRVW